MVESGDHFNCSDQISSVPLYSTRICSPFGVSRVVYDAHLRLLPLPMGHAVALIN